MPNALDTFRAQREAADAIYARLTEVSDLFRHLRTQADALVRNDELRTMLRHEETWLAQAQRTVADVSRWRELELHRFWPGVVHRWALALAFALAGAWAAGAGYAWVTEPYAAELSALRSRMEFGSLVEHRVLTMTPAERRQFNTLMRWGAAERR